ncbi:FAD/NAD-P-binding domain-containing protein [Infundibulicybe gibba]|nr:FAD/NAD-P-binding domain-containing protein [Infundibulicybe gibba]
MEGINTAAPPESIGIVGAGAAGLITAQVLLRDGFNVQVITRDSSAGGIWARSRIYPGLSLNNVQGEFQFSSLSMKHTPSKMGNRLSGYDMCNYMETFAEKYLAGKIQFNTEVLDIRRSASGKWAIHIERKPGDCHTSEVLEFDRIVLCTGGCSTPYIPSQLLQEQSRFNGLVLHSSEFRARLDEILASVQPRSDKAAPCGSIVVVGGGKSAQDIAAYLANEGQEVKVVFETADAFIATPIQLPAFLRNRSRFIGAFSPHSELHTRLERFLHKTWIGGKIVHFFWNQIEQTAFSTASIPSDSPLRRAHPIFWGIRTNDEGAGRPNGFHALVNSGKIGLIAPHHAAGFTPDGKSLILDNGEALAADVVVFATGYTSSWNKIMSADTARDLGINRHPLEREISDVWNYTSLRNPPPGHPDQTEQSSSIYRGIIPAKNICRRDFVINGGIFSTNNGYTFEVVAHWISSYFLGDRMRLPSSPEEALDHAERNSLWLRKRYPNMLLWTNESYSSNLAFWTWPQVTDELLEDMHLPSRRSGGNWLTWPFKVIDVKEIRSLAEERRQLRSSGGLNAL